MTEKSSSDLACIILAAGQGTRMRSDVPKVLHKVVGLPLISHVIHASADTGAQKIVVVVPPGAEAIQKAVAPHLCVFQAKPLGTGDAVKAARNELKNFNGDILVLFADTPLMTKASLELMQETRQKTGAAVVVAGFKARDPGSYGRLILDSFGTLTEIVEASEATLQQKEVSLCNGGAMLFDSAKLWPLLDQIKDSNAKKEFFLTDCVSLACQSGHVCAVASIPSDEVLGINNRIELAHAENLMQKRLRSQAMLSGVTLIDPDTVYLSFDTKIGRDVIIGPNVVIGPGVEIADKVDIRAFCVMDQVKIEAGATIGPFARLRPGTVIGAEAHIGNFVEIKNSDIGQGAKVNHLAYIGDASLGSKVNVGAGTVTANFDGFKKSRTHVGREASLGANSVLVAPISVGEGAYIGAGSVITNDVPAHALAIARGRQANREDWARRVRAEKAPKDKT